jgi:hypothetical protein
MPIVIGFSGRAKNGKDEACHSVATHVRLQGGRAKVYDIGEIIRRWCVANGRLPADVKRADMTPAQLKVLVDAGLERTDQWSETVAEEIRNDGVDVALICNCRYPVNLKMVSELGGHTVRMTRLNADGSVYVSDDRPPNHPGETTLQFHPHDFYITVRDGQQALVGELAITTYEYIAGLK